ncbi:DUF2516 family protein [Kocuria coralli]|uniref:DUF2516 family protein n=1 Tax=Kocuria coralli TaxID=1461025 RepID=A0A5J5KUU3_9MICC|nr:DUF2516 family protein [Kocuria coralli]KAA9393469.1 DUF2516 family protein [Kocuria coralli]
MSPTPFQYLIAQIVSWTNVAVLVFVAVLCAMAFFHCLSRTKAVQFERAFKRTRNFWMAVTGACFAITALLAVTTVASVVAGRLELSVSYIVSMIAATACGVYLADVKPAVDIESSGPSAW